MKKLLILLCVMLFASLSLFAVEDAEQPTSKKVQDGVRIEATADMVCHDYEETVEEGTMIQANTNERAMDQVMNNERNEMGNFADQPDAAQISLNTTTQAINQKRNWNIADGVNSEEIYVDAGGIYFDCLENVCGEKDEHIENGNIANTTNVIYEETDQHLNRC